MDCGLYHVNWHTMHRAPVFLDVARESWLKDCFDSIAVAHGLPVLASEVLSTHVHVVVATLPDLPHQEIVRLLKGGSSRQFFIAFPDFRLDLGTSLWQRGYQWVLIRDRRQLRNTLQYVRTNQARHGKLPPDWNG